MENIEIVNRRDPVWTSLLWMVIAVIPITASILTHSPHGAIFAILPASLATTLLLTRREPQRLKLTSDSIEFIEPFANRVQYSDLRSVTLGGLPFPPTVRPFPRLPIFASHDGGSLVIDPEDESVRRDVYRHLIEQFAPGGSRDIVPTLTTYVADQEGRFGAEHVWTYSGRPFKVGRRLRPRAWAVTWTFLGVGLLWIPLGVAVKEGAGWAGFGALIALLSALVIVLRKRPNRRFGIKSSRSCAIVVSPAGLVLNQGPLEGELAWEELRAVKLVPLTRGLQVTADGGGPGLYLNVAGATIIVRDVYDRPLPVIASRIQRYWRPSVSVNHDE